VLLNFFRNARLATHRVGSPAADYSKTIDPRRHLFLANGRRAPSAEGGQVEPVFGGCVVRLAPQE